LDPGTSLDSGMKLFRHQNPTEGNSSSTKRWNDGHRRQLLSESVAAPEVVRADIAARVCDRTRCTRRNFCTFPRWGSGQRPILYSKFLRRLETSEMPPTKLVKFCRRNGCAVFFEMTRLPERDIFLGLGANGKNHHNRANKDAPHHVSHHVDGHRAGDVVVVPRGIENQFVGMRYLIYSTDKSSA
jgi:hypothetical protein